MWSRLRGKIQKKDFLFVVGLVGIALEEGRIFGQPSETMILVFAAMIGLRFVMKADEVKAEEKEATPSKHDTRNGGNSSGGPDVTGHTSENGVIP